MVSSSCVVLKGGFVAAMAAAVLAALALQTGDASATGLVAFKVEGDVVRQALGRLIGRPEQGRRIVLDRKLGNCLICHTIRSLDEPFQGVLGPVLDGVGRRLSVGQIRLRLIDQRRLNAATIMPSYYRVEGLRDVAPAYRGRPVLDAQQIEDVVAYLATLKE